MKIVVCMKQVPDPEGSQDCFVIDESTNSVMPKGIPPVLSLYDENALEAALQIKDSQGSSVQITVVTLGKKVSKAVVMRALAAGADEVIKVENEAFESGVLDSFDTAKSLACVIKMLGDADLVLTGRQAADWNSGQVGILLSEVLQIPCVTLAMGIEVEGETIRVKRVIQNGYEVVESASPLVVVVSNEAGELRYPAMKLRREAKNKPITALGFDAIGFEAENRSKVQLDRLEMAVIPTRQCEFIESSSLQEAGKMLARKMQNSNLLRG